MPFDDSRPRQPYNHRFVYPNRRPDSRYAPPMRRPDPRFDTKVLQIDMSDNLLAEVRDIANERNVSLYRQIREFVQQGVNEYREDQRIAERDKSDVDKDVFEEGWIP